MVDRFFRFLVAILLVGLCVVLLIYVLGVIGIHIPAMVLNIIYALAVVIVLWTAWRYFGGYVSNPFTPPPTPPPPT
jgi:hypothetical protein